MKITIQKNKLFINILVVILILLFPIIFFAKNIFLAALVNGTPITRLTVIKELEKQNGKRALDALVNQELIFQAAKKKNLEIKPAVVDQEVKKIETNTAKQGGNLDEILKAQGMTRNDLKNQIKVQLTVEKLLADKIKISQKEIDQFIQANTSEEEGSTQKPPTKDEAKDQLRQQKLQKEATAWIEQLKKNAKISIFVNY